MIHVTFYGSSLECQLQSNVDWEGRFQSQGWGGQAGSRRPTYWGCRGGGPLPVRHKVCDDDLVDGDEMSLTNHSSATEQINITSGVARRMHWVVVTGTRRAGPDERTHKRQAYISIVIGQAIAIQMSIVVSAAQESYCAQDVLCIHTWVGLCI